MSFCYQGYIYDFLSLDKERLVKNNEKNYQVLCGENPSVEQIHAWEDSHAKIHPVLEEYKHKKYCLIFEYELPHEGGRRTELYSGIIL